MKILFDQNISFKIIRKIDDIFPLAKQVRNLNLENSSDRKKWEFAKENDYTIITFDADFYDFSIVWGHPPKIVWIRTGNKTTSEVEQILRKHSETIKKFKSDEKLACLEVIG
ncbi:MAG: DUF5615 family PIN-like protein [Crocinitomicaceae bacterium]